MPGSTMAERLHPWNQLTREMIPKSTRLIFINGQRHDADFELTIWSVDCPEM